MTIGTALRTRLLLLGGALGLPALAGALWLTGLLDSPAPSTAAMLMIGSSLTGIALLAWLHAGHRSRLRKLHRALQSIAANAADAGLPDISADAYGDLGLSLHRLHECVEALRQRELTDPLTGVGSRQRMQRDLHQALDGRGQQPLVMICIHLDRLRTINDSLGHRAGDRVICETASRLRRHLPVEARISRPGGNQFAVVLDADPGDGAEAAERHLSRRIEALFHALCEPQMVQAQLLPMSVSVGVALYPSDGSDPSMLFTAAEAAMYSAKRAGGKRIEYARPELTSGARERLAMIADIRRGLAAGEFEPWYQPLVDVDSGRVVGAEALLRWHHRHDGIRMPGQFIELAEEAGLIGSLGEQCLRRSWDYHRHWRDRGRELKVSVNLSARQIEDRSILPLLRTMQPANDPKPGVDFEITETAMLSQVDQARDTCREIHRMGFRLSVDDFGTGYSSLSYVQQFPISKIKIDRSFVSKIETSPEAQAIISATIALAERLNYEVVAEGVETESQMRKLRELGCKIQQGYWFSRALPAAEFENWVDDFEARATA